MLLKSVRKMELFPCMCSYKKNNTARLATSGSAETFSPRTALFVGASGFEPLTSCMSSKHSNQLS